MWLAVGPPGSLPQLLFQNLQTTPIIFLTFRNSITVARAVAYWRCTVTSSSGIDPLYSPHRPRRCKLLIDRHKLWFADSTGLFLAVLSVVAQAIVSPFGTECPHNQNESLPVIPQGYTEGQGANTVASILGQSKAHTNLAAWTQYPLFDAQSDYSSFKRQ